MKCWTFDVADLKPIGDAPERHQQVGQAIVVNLVHQRQQPANLDLWKNFVRKPRRVIAREVGQKRAFVFPRRHRHGDECFQPVAQLRRRTTAA